METLEQVVHRLLDTAFKENGYDELKQYTAQQLMEDLYAYGAEIEDYPNPLDIVILCQSWLDKQ